MKNCFFRIQDFTEKKFSDPNCKSPEKQKIITARVRSTTGRLCFDTCLSVCHRGGGSVSRLSRGGVRSSQQGGGQLQPARGGVRSSGGGGSAPAGRGGGHYTAGSMPLAFTQEDFLILNVI